MTDEATEMLTQHGNIAFTFDLVNRTFEQVLGDESHPDYVEMPSPSEVWPEIDGQTAILSMATIVCHPDDIMGYVDTFHFNDRLASTKAYVLASCEHVREDAAHAMGLWCPDLAEDMALIPEGWLVSVLTVIDR